MTQPQFYEEFPVDNVVDVSWKKPGKPDRGCVIPGPCGMLKFIFNPINLYGFYFDDAGYIYNDPNAWATQFPKIGIGPRTFARSFDDSGNAYMSTLELHDHFFSGGLVPYVCWNPDGYVITALSASTGALLSDKIELFVWRNLHPGSWDVCMAPDLILPNGSFVERRHYPKCPDDTDDPYFSPEQQETFSPIVTLHPIEHISYFNPCMANSNDLEVHIQAICPQQTTGALPPQPEGAPRPTNVITFGPVPSPNWPDTTHP